MKYIICFVMFYYVSILANEPSPLGSQKNKCLYGSCYSNKNQQFWNLSSLEFGFNRSFNLLPVMFGSIRLESTDFNWNLNLNSDSLEELSIIAMDVKKYLLNNIIRLTEKNVVDEYYVHTGKLFKNVLVKFKKMKLLESSLSKIIWFINNILSVVDSFCTTENLIKQKGYIQSSHAKKNADYILDALNILCERLGNISYLIPKGIPINIKSRRVKLLLMVESSHLLSKTIAHSMLANYFHIVDEELYENKTIFLSTAHIDSDCHWGPEMNPITEIVILKLMELAATSVTQHYTYIEHPLNPIDIYFKSKIPLTPTNLDVKLEPLNTQLIQGLSFASLHRLIVPQGSNTLIFELSEESLYDNIKVYVSFNVPTYETLNSRKNNINKHIAFSYNNLTKDNNNVYITVLGKKRKLFNISIYLGTCQTWTKHSWNTGGCQFIYKKEFIERNVIHCRCQHLSVISGSFFLGPLRNVSMPFSQESYPHVKKSSGSYFLWIIIPLLFIPIFLVAWYKDNRDNLRKKIMFLSDNFPGDRYSYLLTVHTSGRFAASTNVKVGIQLFGSDYNSRAHVLKTKRMRILFEGSEDWFLIFTRHHLGSISHILLWQDNIKQQDDWFCKRIVLNDLLLKKRYIFEINEWITAKNYDIKEEPFNYFPILDEKMDDDFNESWEHLFSSEVSHALLDKNRFICVFSRESRPLFTRKERVGIFLIYISLTLYLNVKYFHLAYDGPFDSHALSVARTEISIAFEITFLQFIFAFTGMVLFSLKLSNNPEIIKIKMRNLKQNIKEYKRIETTKSMESRLQQANRKLPIIYHENKFFNTVLKLVAWLYVIAMVLLVIIYLIGLYHRDIGDFTLMCISALGIGNNIYILEPVKIIFLAILVSSLFQKQSVESYVAKYEDIIVLSRTNLNKFLIDFMTRRLQSRYKPMPLTNLKHIQTERSRSNRYWIIAIHSLLLLLIFLILMSFYVFMDIKTKYFYNDYTKYLTKTGLTPYSLSQNEVHGKMELDIYLNFTLMPNLKILVPQDPTIWNYKSNSLIFNKRVTYFYGTFQLRQQRISPNCIKEINNSLMKWFNGSFGYLNVYNEDIIKYNEQWAPWHNASNNKQASRPYSNYLITAANGVFGSTGIYYRAGGYCINTESKPVEIIEAFGRSCCDNYTRSVILNMNLYNININLFQIITIIFEHHPSGLYALKTRVEAGEINERRFSRIIVESILIVFLFALFILLFIFILYKSSKVGFIKFLRSWWGICDSLLIFVGTQTVYNHLVSLIASSYYNEKTGNKFYSYFIGLEISMYFINAKEFISGLAFCVIFFCFVNIALHLFCFHSLEESAYLSLKIVLFIFITILVYCELMNTFFYRFGKASFLSFLTPFMIKDLLAIYEYVSCDLFLPLVFFLGVVLNGITLFLSSLLIYCFRKSKKRNVEDKCNYDTVFYGQPFLPIPQVLRLKGGRNASETLTTHLILDKRALNRTKALVKLVDKTDELLRKTDLLLSKIEHLL